MTATARIIQLPPPARTQRATKPKAPPSPFSPEGMAFKAAMSSLDAANTRAQVCAAGSTITMSAEAKRLLAEAIRHAQAARRLL